MARRSSVWRRRECAESAPLTKRLTPRLPPETESRLWEFLEVRGIPLWSPFVRTLHCVADALKDDAKFFDLLDRAAKF